LLPTKRQTLMFSATFSKEIRSLASGYLDNPISVEVNAPNATAELVEQYVYTVDKKKKAALLSHLINENGWHQVLVFTRTKHGANKLSQQLEKNGITALPIHGNKSQNARTKALEGFKRGRVQALVATDIAARGLDIEQLPQVVNFDLPNISEDYVHRIGRTGRAGSTGHAYSLVSADEADFLAGIEKLIKQKLPREEVAGFETEHAVPEGRAGKSGVGNRPASNNRGGGSRDNNGPRGHNKPGGSRPRSGAGSNRSGSNRSGSNRSGGNGGGGNGGNRGGNSGGSANGNRNAA
jgi:ATP-dependent RNA helicase RhlE